MFKITKGKGYTLQELAAIVAKYLNPKKGKNYTDSSLISRINKKIKDPGTNATHIPFYQYLVDKDNKILMELLEGKPEQLAKKIKEIDKLVAAGNFPAFYQLGAKGEKKSTVFGAEVLKLFGYKNFRKSKKFSLIYKALDRRYCNYCNLDTTLSLATGQSLFDCDHYFAKVEYPYLCVSFYNLVSSCTICNTRLKTAKALNLQKYPHPYLDEVHDYIRFTPDKPLDVGNNIDDFQIVAKRKPVSRTKSTKGLNMVDFFSVDSRYSQLPNDARYLFRRSQEISPTLKQEMYDEQVKLGISVTKNEIIAKLCEKFKVPGSTDEAANITMGKLQLDLADEFKITELF